MILILGSTENWVVRQVTTVLVEQGLSTVVISPENLVFDGNLIWQVGISQHCQLNDGKRETVSIDCSSLAAILWRGKFPLSTMTSDHWSRQDRDYIAKEGYAALLGLLQDCPCPVINQPTPAGDRSRFFFADACWTRRFAEYSIHLPSMCLATSRSLAHEWLQDASGTVRSISLAGADSTGLVPEQSELSEWDYMKSPLCLQTIPSGQWFHVVTCGEEALGGPIDPQVGYGSFVTGVEPQACPSSLIKKCVFLGKTFQMEFAESIWVNHEGGQWYCMDWNSSPQAEHWGTTMHQEIPKLLAKLLVNIS